VNFLNKLKKIKNFFILIIPGQSASDAKSRKFSLTKVFGILLGYTLLISFLGYLFFSITPIGNIFFPKTKTFSDQDIEIINELNNRMVFLSRELEDLKSTNEKLRNAIMLGDSSVIKSLDINADTSSLKKKAGGSILSVIKDLFFREEGSKEKIDYFIKPVNGFISRGFDVKIGHIGIDFVVKVGTPVYAAASGYVVFADYTPRDGYMMIINDADDYITVYKHCSILLKKVRDRVFQGELISLSGNTGEITTGPHLHFEIWKQGRPINPKDVFSN
jgi:murein DD-endopeptidase MepM/ murein hydrolase activator NlpD